MLASTSQTIPFVVHQHVEESAHLRHVRSILTAAPHVKLHHLRRLDDRIAAHLDGLAVAGEFGWKLCEAALENPGVGEMFAATVRAIEERNAQGLDRLLALAEAAAESQRGLISAFGWVSAQFLQGTIANLLASPGAFQRAVGIAACAMHRVDPGAALDAALQDDDTALRARAVRSAGELGRRDLLAHILAFNDDADAGCHYWAARSAVLLGDRAHGLAALMRFCREPGVFRERAQQLALCVVDLNTAHELLRQLAHNPQDIRALIRGAGSVGDPHYVPWLIKQMDDLNLARLAGESFTFITGLDLAYLDLECKPPEGVELGPNDDPDDANVAMDEDDSLPWPDAVKIAAWWAANQQRFESGKRYFMGAPVSREHCLQILKEGCQRQRIAAAQYLCLLQPGTALFNTRAPAWRQQRWLATMV
jgi:uncharacterized protein (TIGR02270 family)